MPRVISELICSDLDASLAFYGLLGFTIRYQHPEERCVYLTRDGAALMLEQPYSRPPLSPTGRELVQPYGRVMNLIKSKVTVAVSFFGVRPPAG